MAINGIISDIAADGISITGTPFGGTRPNLGQLLNSNQQDSVLLISRTVKTTSAINSNGLIALPVAFGQNKYIISFNGNSYCPYVDYIPNTTTSTWINPNISIPINTDITIWGPANDYTANLLTIEPINMHSGIFSGGNISLQGTNGGLSLPANVSSIYLVINGKTVSPSKFTYVEPSIIWNSIPVLNTSDIVFAYYFNKKTSTPYNLFDAQVTNSFSPTAGQTTFSIAAIPRPNMVGASQLFVNNVKAVYGVDYIIQYPFLKWIKQIPFTGSEKLELSFISDQKGTTVITNTTPEPGMVVLDPQGQANVSISGSPILTELSILTINGNLMIAPAYSYITIQNGSNFIPEYVTQNNVLKIDPIARGLPYRQFESSDEYMYSAFKDVGSSKYLKIEYFKGFAGSGDAKTLHETPSDTTKVIVWIDGRAIFSITNEINVVGTQVGINAPYIPSDPNADIVIMYFTNQAYASLWSIEEITFGMTEWGINQTIGDFSSSPIGNINNTFLFVNGQREIVGNYDKTLAGTSLINKNLKGKVYGQAYVVPDQLILFRVR